MSVWSRTLSGRLSRVSSSFSENMAEEDNQSLHNENNRVRTLRDHINPTKTIARSCIFLLLMHLILILSKGLVPKSVFLSRFYIIILHLKYQ